MHRHFQQTLAGLLLSFGIAIAALMLAKNFWLQSHGMGALTIAIAIGTLAGNTVFPRIASSALPGVLFSKQRLLQLGIILYGFRLTFADIAQVGTRGILIDALVLCTTFALAWWVGHRLLKLDRTTAILIGAGSSICGAAAVLATEPVVRGRSEQVSVAIATVLVFGTLSMLLYPMLFEWNQAWQWLPLSPQSFGIFTGSTVHEVAQVVAAAKPLGDAATNTAVITKMVRVMMLAPFLIVLSALITPRGAAENGAVPRSRIVLPWFALWFIVVTSLHSLNVLPPKLVSGAVDLDTLLLAVAMAALGLTTHVSAIRQAGFTPLVLGGILFTWLLLGGSLINRWIWAVY